MANASSLTECKALVARLIRLKKLQPHQAEGLAEYMVELSLMPVKSNSNFLGSNAASAIEEMKLELAIARQSITRCEQTIERLIHG